MDKTIFMAKTSGLATMMARTRGKTVSLFHHLKERLEGGQSLIGVDIGASAVKAVQMVPVNGVMTIVKSSMIPIGPGMAPDEAAFESLKIALVGFETKGTKIVVVVNCPQTCTRHIVTPRMPRKELAEAVRWEAKNTIPFSIDQALMDHAVTGEITEKGVKKLTVAVAASPRETIHRLTGLFERLKVEVAAMIPVSLALQNVLDIFPERKTANIAVVEMGAALTELNIYQKGTLAFSRKLPIAGRDITKSMTSTLMSGQGKVELTLEEAEAIKKEHGLPSGEGDDLIGGKILPSHILSLVRPCVEQLANEIARSFDFYREQSHGETVGQILLFGGGANLKGLVPFLRQELSVDIALGNAFEGVACLSGIETNGEHAGTRMDLAVGAVLNGPQTLNLLPVELKEKTRRFIEHVSLQAIAVGAAVMLALAYIGFNIQAGAQQKKIDVLKLERRALSPQIETLRSVMVVQQILSAHPYWEDVLRAISHAVGPQMYLTEIRMLNDRIILEGVIFKSNDGAQGILSDFMITLEEGVFRHVSLVTARKNTDDPSETEFEISAEIE